MMRKKLDLLILEEDRYDAEQIVKILTRGGFEIDARYVDNEEGFKAQLHERLPDIILSDTSLHQYSGIRALEYSRVHCPATPFIFVTGTLDEETAAETIKAGAWDYVVKERLSRLTSAVENALKLKRERDKIAEAEQKLNILSKAIQQASSAVVITNSEGIIEYVNPKFTVLTGFSQNEAIGKTPGILKSGKQTDEFYTGMWNTIIAGDEWKGEIVNKKKNGELYWESTSIAGVKNKENIITHYVAIKEDITEKKKIEEELKHAKMKAEESDRLKSAFLASLSHEVRTPMNGILGFSRLLKTGRVSDAKKEVYIEAIEKSGTNLLNIISDLIEISKIETGTLDVYLSVFDANDLLDELFKLYKADPPEEKKDINLSLHKEFPDKETLVYSDRLRIHKVLSNFLSNAYKFTAKGEIKLGYKFWSDERIQFFVSDTGIGFDEPARDIIFEKFRQVDDSDIREFEGAGLGLAIAKGIAARLNGEIGCESEPGSGSTFYLTLPYDKAKVSEIITLPPGEVKYNWEGKNILIAEDEYLNYLLFEELLKETKVNTIHAENGKRAIEIMKNGRNIDLILMDIRMPEMDGIEATVKIREFDQKIPIIVQTAYNTIEDIKAVQNAGCNDIITKPIEASQLYEKIAVYFGQNK